MRVYTNSAELDAQSGRGISKSSAEKYISGGAQLSRDIQNEPCYTSITLFCLKEIELK